MNDLENSVDKVLEDVDYVVSDTHLGHKNIIKYCRNSDFEFSDEGLQEMNETIKDNWNSTVSEGDTVLFLGDLAWLSEQTSENVKQIDEIYNSLNGDIVPLKGDHDAVRPTHVEDWDYSALVRHNGKEYLAAHFPGDTPPEYPGSGMPEEFRLAYEDIFQIHDGLTLHGHHHNNHIDRYPFYNPEPGSINCSAELLDYRPVSMDKIDLYVEEGKEVQKIGS